MNCIIKITLFLTLFGPAAYCQQAKEKIQFSSINQVGILSGQGGGAFTAQSVNGVMKGKWFAGAGVGLDPYQERTIPVFLDVRRNLGNSINVPYVYADAGINFLALPTVDKIQNFERKTTPGLYYDLGLGWKLVFKNNRGLLLSAGYTLKQVREQYKLQWGAPTAELQSDNYDRYKYSYRRLVIRIGLQL